MIEPSPSSATYRVTVRGRFDGLGAAARAWLQQHRAEHDVFASSFSAEGTLSYDDRLDFFNLRYEVRLGGDASPERAVAAAEAEAEAFLRTLRLGHRGLHSDVMDLQAMTAHRKPRRHRSDGR